MTWSTQSREVKTLHSLSLHMYWFTILDEFGDVNFQLDRIHIKSHDFNATLTLFYGNYQLATFLGVYIHTYVHMYMHTYIHMYICTYVRIYMHMCELTVWRCVHTYVCTYVHAYIHTYVHMYICTYIHAHV